MPKDVLEFVRQRDERLRKVPDAELTRFIGETYPEFIRDPEFAKKYAGSSSLGQPYVGGGLPRPRWDPAQADAFKPPGATLEEYQTKVKEQAAQLREVYDAHRGMAGDDPARLARAKLEYVEGLKQIGIEPISELPDPIRLVGNIAGPPLARGGRVMGAVAGDIVDVLARPESDAGEELLPNLRAFANEPEQPLPITSELQQMPGWARIPGKVTQGIAQALPRMGVAAALGGVGASAPVANLGAMAFDEQGEIDPIGVLAATGLPFVDRLGRQLAASAIQKALAKPIVLTQPGEAAAKIAAHYPQLQKEAVQRALEVGGGQLANNAYLLALQTPGILQSDNPGQALEDAVLGNLALSIMGAGEVTRGRSRTMEELAAKAERGEPFLNVRIEPPLEPAPAGTRNVTPAAPPAVVPRPPALPAAPTPASPLPPVVPIRPSIPPDAGRTEGPSIPPPSIPPPSIPPDAGRTEGPSIPPDAGRTEGPSIPPDRPSIPPLAHPGNQIADYVADLLRGGLRVSRDIVVGRGTNLGLTPREAEEWGELGATEAARDIAQDASMSPREKYWALLSLYDRMPGSAERTVESKLAQQYSTPPPLAWVASILADVPGGSVFVDPTAGHGMLSIGANQQGRIALNELDPNRRLRLRRFVQEKGSQRGAVGYDATSPEFYELLARTKADRLGMNPPFGNLLDAEGKPREFRIAGASVNANTTRSIDIAIVLNSLQAMVPAGKAFAIIGAKTGTPFGGTFGTDADRAQSYHRPVYLDLFNRFKVVDWFTLGGDLYRRMGAAWPVDVIIVHGKGKTPGHAEGGLVRPWLKPPRVIETWEQLAELLPKDERDQDQPTQPGETGAAPSGGRPGGAGGGAGGQRPARPGTPPPPAARPQQPARPGGGGGGSAAPPTERPSPTPAPPSGVPGDSGAGIGTGTPEPAGGVAGGGTKARKPGTTGVGGQGPVAPGSSPAESGGVSGKPKPSVPVEGLPASLMVPYEGLSRGPSLNLVAPRNIATQMREALLALEKEVGKPLDEYVAELLDRDVATLHKQLAGAQVDAVALALRNLERGSALITADETGVGKGRVVAAIIEYARLRDLVPVFVTAKKNLYADMAGRDLPALGNKDFKPFITDTQSYYEDGHGREHKVSRTSKQMTELMERAARTGVLPEGAEGIFTTYDQLKADRPAGFTETAKQKAARKRKRVERPDGPRWAMLRALAPKAVFILDEAHIAAGLDSELNVKFGSVLPNAKGLYYSSATFAKRPDNLGLYALGTSMKTSGLNNEQLTEALKKGGVPMQQALTSMLASSGELVRRQQDWTGVAMQFKATSADPAREIEAADTYTSFIRDLMSLAKLINRAAKALEDGENQVRADEQSVTIEPITFGARLFNLSNQYLLALRAEAIVREAVAQLQAGRKPFIALYNTMEGPITDLRALGLPISFSGILRREMVKMLKLTVRDPMAEGGKREVELQPEDLPDGGEFYRRLEQEIDATDFTGFPISPIDFIKRGLTQAGYKVGELTARDGEVDDTGAEVLIQKREKLNRNKILKAYNDGELDALIVNGSGSTGLSAHTDPRFKDQRQRVMIVGQPAPDINEFMQMLGRVMRSGQTSKPEYRILTTALAAERRFATMLRGKMTSLNANTTAEGESSMTQAEGFAEDVFNSVGDEVVFHVMEANVDLAALLELDVTSEEAEAFEGFARYATGRFVLLPNADAQRLWNEIIKEFKSEVEQLDESGQNPLRAVAEDLRARTVDQTNVVEGGGDTPFNGPVILETATVKPPKAPPTHEEAIQQSRDNIAAVREASSQWLEGSKVAESERLATARARGATPDQLDRIRQTFQNVRVAVTELYRKIGDTFGVDMLGDGTSSFYGVGVDLKLSGNSVSDYASASRQQFILRTNTYKGKLTLPISKLYKDGVEQQFLNYVDEESAPEKFNSTAENQATRRIITGNLLRGWEYADNASRGTDQGRPRVAIYTREDGSLATGILMPPNWQPAEVPGQVMVGSAQEFVTFYRQQAPMRSTPISAVHPVQVVAGRLAVPSNNSAKVVWGDPVFGRFFEGTPRQVAGNFVGVISPQRAGPLFEFLQAKGVRLILQAPWRPASMKAGGGGGQPSSARGGFVTGVTVAPGRLPPTVTYGGMDLVYPLEMPELVRLVRELTGYLPKLKTFPRRGNKQTLGQFGDGMITLDRRLFKDPGEAAKVLLHEIGHLVDYLPHQTLKRGNLLGHLLAMQGFLRHTWGQLNNKELRAELIAVTRWWRPFDEAADPKTYVEYRKSPEELYADAFSVLFNAPSELEARAPTFYKAFWEQLDRRPEVKSALFAILQLLSTGKVPVLEQRQQEREEMFFKGDEILKRKVAEREQRRRSWKGYWLELEQVLFDRYEPIIVKARQAEAAGASFPAAKDPRNILEEGVMQDNDNARFVRRVFEGVVKPLEEAGLSLTQMGDYLFLRRIEAGDRATFANPLGTTPATARLGLLKMRLDLGMPGMTRLERAVETFHRLVFEVIEEAVRVGSYNKGVFNSTIKPNKDVYAAFAVLDYLEDYVPAGVKQQIGTLKEVANPFTATVLKAVSLNNLNSIQRSKNATRDLLRTHFPGEIEVAKGKFLAPGVTSRPPPRADKGLLEILENGRRAYYYVDPLIAHSFEQLAAGGLARVTRVLDWIFRKGFYRAYITYSPSFLTFNPMRDFKRSWKSLPAGTSRLTLARAYFDAFKSALSHVRGLPDALATEMMANYALGTPYDTLVSMHRDDPFADIMRRFHLLPEQQQNAFWSSVVGKPLRAIAHAFEFYGQLQETLPKIAAYRILRKQMHLPPAAAAREVRNHIGTPNVRKRGTDIQVIRAIWPFYNVFIQGWRADVQKMKPKSQSGWLFKWAISDGWFAIFSALAGAGLLGALLKDLFGGASEYDKTNFNVLPVGLSTGGEFGRRAHYFRVPRDESSRLLSGLTYKMARLMAGDSPEHFSDLLEFGGGQIPTMNPAITIPLAWGVAAAGGNPPDVFRGRPVIPRTEYEAGGTAVLGPMFRWTIDQSGLGNFVSWNPSAQTTTELTLSAVPGLKSLLKSSDYGYREQQQAKETDEEQARARHRLDLPDNARSLALEWSALKNIDVTRRTPQQTARYEVLTIWHNTTYRKLEEQIWLAEQAKAKTTANFFRRQLEFQSRAYAK